MNYAIERRRKLLELDLEARCVIGGPEVDAELLVLVDEHLERQKRYRLLDAMFEGSLSIGALAHMALDRIRKDTGP